MQRFGAAPCAAVAAALGPARGFGAAGRVLADNDDATASPTTPFDLASVTKPFVALTLCRLEKAGVLSRNEPLGRVVPELSKTRAGDTTLDHLAAHRAGLAPHLRLFAPLEEGRSVIPNQALEEAANALRPECSGLAPKDGFPPVYSDLGYMLLGLAIETRCQKPLDEVVAEEVLDPLELRGRIGSARQLELADPLFGERVAPTEVVSFRGGRIRGVVHDENAFAITGKGLSGHAGLFGEAPAVLSFGLHILSVLRGESSWLSARELEPAVRARPGGSLLAGFDAKSGEIPAAGTRVGRSTFGHLGFTGTSLWIDPEAGFVGVLLTNRVNPTREHIAIRAARPAVYDAMFDALSAIG